MRVRQHVNPLKSDYFTIAPAAVLVPAGMPLEVELGSAEAWFLMDRAREEPRGCYVGVEIRRDLVDKANGSAAGGADPGAERVRQHVGGPAAAVRRGAGAAVLPELSRSLVQARSSTSGGCSAPTLIDDLARLLEPGGELHVNTDIFEHALDAMSCSSRNRSGASKPARALELSRREPLHRPLAPRAAVRAGGHADLAAGLRPDPTLSAVERLDSSALDSHPVAGV